MLNIYMLHMGYKLSMKEFNDLLGLVSNEKKKRIKRFIRFEDAQRTLIGDILVRYAICQQYEIRNPDLTFDINIYGKPMLVSHKGICFNISHSGQWIVCVISDTSVGIDVETIRPIDITIAKMVFSKMEYLSFLTQKINIQLQYFYSLWTLKESYIKAEGEGLSIPLQSFTIKMEKEKRIQVLKDNDITDWNFQQIILDDISVCSICSLINEQSKNKFFTLDKFLAVVENKLFK